MIDYKALNIALEKHREKETALVKEWLHGRPLKQPYYDLLKEMKNVYNILKAGKAKGDTENGADTAICRDAMAEGQQRQ